MELPTVWCLVYHDFDDGGIELSVYTTFEKMLEVFDRDLEDDMAIYNISGLQRDVECKALYYHADGRTGSFEVLGYESELN